MPAEAILIITEEFDIHADRLVQLLTERGERVVRFHTADYRLKDVLNFIHHPDGRLEGSLLINDRVLYQVLEGSVP